MKKVALITGASAGIGAELARVFARHGHELVLVARRQDRLHALAAEIAAAGRARPAVLALDLEQRDAVARIAAELSSRGLEPEIVVNNAGFGLLGYAGTKILNPAFYALSDARTPMYVSVFSVLGNFCMALVLLGYFHLGFSALALSTSIVAIVSSVCLFESLRRKLGGIEGRYLIDRVARVIAASLLMTLAIVFANHMVGQRMTASRVGYLADLAVCLPLGMLVFVGASRLLGVHEISLASNLFLARLRRGNSREPRL